MKTNITATFEGSLEQLNRWVQDTFKDPSAIFIKAEIIMADPTSLRRKVLLEAVDRRMAEIGIFNPGVGAELLLAALEAMCEANRSGKIQAIKACREKTGCGLKEAKDFVESDAFLNYYDAFLNG